MKKIIIIDDDLMNLRSLAHTLEEWGYEAHCFTEYNREVLHNNPAEILCFIVDYRLLDMDGLVVIRHLKDIYPKIPMILISGYQVESGMLNENRDYVHTFLEKPLNIRTLHNILVKI